MYRVAATYRNGETATRHYQTPEAAEERRQRFEAGRVQMLSEAHAADHLAAGTEPGRDVPEVTVTASHPITYPHAAGDLDKLDGPDGRMGRGDWEQFATALGLDPRRILSVTIAGDELAAEYQPDAAGKAAPKVWRVALE